MIYGSNPQLASDPDGGLRCCAARRVIVLIVLLLAGWLQGLTPAGECHAAEGPPEVRFGPEVRSGVREQTWLAEDRTWLRRLPREAWLLPTDVGGGSPSVADSLAAIRRWVTAVAGSDSGAVAQTLEGRLRQRWLDRGRLAVRVARLPAADDDPDTLQLSIGPAFMIEELQVAGEPFPGREHLIATWLPRAGDEFLPAELDLGIDRVLKGAGEAGYPFPRWVTRSVDLDLTTATVTIDASLLPGAVSWLGPVTSDLPAGRASDFLVRASGLRSGAPFSHSELSRAAQRLLARDMYASVDEPRVYLTSAVDTVGVHFPVTPRRKVNRLQVVLGLSRGTADQGSHLSGQVDLNLPNMAGSGRSLAVGWSDDGTRRSQFGFSYLEPLAFGTPLDTDIALDNEVERGIYTRFRFDNRWRLPVVALWGVELGVGWDRSTFPVGSLERTSRTRVRGAVSHRRGDRTRSGWEGVFAVENGWRSASARSSEEGSAASTGALAESVVQRIFEVDTAGEWWLGQAWSLAGRASFRELTGGGDEVPLSEQFRFGGATTVRGYRENAFNGSTAAWASVELRIGPPGGSRLYTFLDLGYFEFSALDPTLEDPENRSLVQGWPQGYGLGLLAKTPGGDISLAVGFPGTMDFDLAKLHVTLLESF